MAETKLKKAKFYQAVLKEVKGNVLEHVYGKTNMLLSERMGSELANCPACFDESEGKITNDWMILAKETVAVTQGGKPYIECLHCGYMTHL